MSDSGGTGTGGVGGRPVARVTLGRDSTRRTYDRLSRWYDLLEGHWEHRARRLALEALSARSGESVLEVGFGTGHVLEGLARATAAEGFAVGIDLAPGMIRVTRSRLAARALPRMPAFVEGDAVHLPFADRVFDAAFSSFVLELFDTPIIPQVLAECYRVLRPGGRLSVVSLTRAGPDRVGLRRLYDWGHERFPAVLDCRPIYPRADLEAAGFRTTRDRLLTIWGLPVEVVVGEVA